MATREITPAAWGGSKPALKRALVARALGTDDSAAIDRGVRRYDAALRGTAGVAPAPDCASGFCAPDAAAPDGGRVPGIDGVLDQIAGAMMRQARTELVPALRDDAVFIERIGTAIGREVAKPTWLIVAFSAAGLAWQISRGR